MLRAVLFDLDGTLLDRETCVRNCIESQFTRFQDRLPSVGPKKFVALFSALDKRGYVPKKAVYEALGLEMGIREELAAALMDDYFQTYPKFCAGFRNMLVTLTTLKERGMKLAIVTNGAVAFQLAAIRELAIEHLFDTIAISEAEGVRKPDSRIFNLVLRRLRTAPAEAIFIGDHPEIDIRGAQNAGMRAIWKRDDYWGACPFANAVIDELDELPGALRLLDAS